MEGKKIKKSEPVVKGKVTIETNKNKVQKKNIILISIIAVIIVAVLIAVTLSVLSFLKTPYYAVKKSFNAIKKGDITTINETMSYDELMESLMAKTETRQEMTDLDKNCFEKFEYKIEKVQVQDDTAIVTVATVNKNFRNALTKWSQSIYQKFINGDEISNSQGENLLNECLSDETIGTMSVTEDITLKKVDDKWQIQIDESLQNAIFPGLSEIAASAESILTE